MSWTDERVELLKKLWADGLSAAQCAGELGGLTRNAVIGKVCRLGLCGRQKPRSAATRIKRKPRERRIEVRTRLPDGGLPPAEISAPIIAPFSDQYKVHFMSFTHDHSKCSWPLWGEDVPLADKFYCGSPTNGNSICVFHASAGQQPLPPRKRPYWTRNGKAA